jgi:hypothetical protein
MTRRTWLVECYGPAIDAASVAEASDRIRASIEVVRAGGVTIEYLGALFVAADEVVFHAFAAVDCGEVAEVSRRAGLAHERIVESVGVTAPSLADALTRLLATPDRTRRNTSS